MKALPATLQF